MENQTDYEKDLDLTKEEALALRRVKTSAKSSRTAHAKGVELKEVDRVAAEVANSEPYRNALRKIHEAEKQASEISEIDQ